MYKVFFLMLLSSTVLADDNSQLNEIYGSFNAKNLDLKNIAEKYDEDIIHLSVPGYPLLRGKENFLATNISPLVSGIQQGDIKVEMKTYIMRRIIQGDMANDVGYLYAKITLADGRIQEQLQKYSWVMLKEKGHWRVITDADGIDAPLTLLDKIEPFIILE